jgi:hypothetical protein
MSRNLDRRVEVCFPVEQPNLRQRLIDLLDLMLSDNRQARLQLPDGRYAPVPVLGPEVAAPRTQSGRIRAYWEERKRQPPACRPTLSQRGEDVRDGNRDVGQTSPDSADPSVQFESNLSTLRSDSSRKARIIMGEAPQGRIGSNSADTQGGRLEE